MMFASSACRKMVLPPGAGCGGEASCEFPGWARKGSVSGSVTRTRVVESGRWLGVSHSGNDDGCHKVGSGLLAENGNAVEAVSVS
jgi:hypothetical protein